MYTQIVVDYCPPKKDPNIVRLNAGDNLIKYPGELTTRTSDLTSSKILWKSVLIKYGAEYMCVYTKKFYIVTLIDWYEYMRVPLALFPDHTIEKYYLLKHANNYFVYVEIRKSIYGLPWSRALTDKILK